MSLAVHWIAKKLYLKGKRTTLWNVARFDLAGLVSSPFTRNPQDEKRAKSRASAACV